MRYTLILAALGALASTTLAAVDPNEVIAPSQTSFATVTVATPVQDVQTVSADDQYVAGSMPIVTKTTTVPNPTAINFDLHECVVHASLEWCLAARHKHDDPPAPEITNAGYCYHAEHAMSYDYVLKGVGPWAGTNGVKVEEAVKDAKMNKVTRWEFLGNTTGTDVWQATWRTMINTRHRMDKHIRRIPGAPNGFTCKSKKPKASEMKAAGIPAEGQGAAGAGAAESEE